MCVPCVHNKKKLFSVCHELFFVGTLNRHCGSKFDKFKDRNTYVVSQQYGQ